MDKEEINGIGYIQFVNTFRSISLASTFIGEYVFTRFEDNEYYQLLLYGVTHTEKPYLLLDDNRKLWENHAVFIPLAVVRDKVGQLLESAKDMATYLETQKVKEGRS